MAQQKRLDPVTIENARIIFRNFEGKEGQYNREGDRNFGVVLPPDVAEAMAEDGWNVKYLKPREEGDLPTPWIQVSVSYKGRPPRVVMISSRGRTSIPEDMVGMLDWADMQMVDLILNPYQWVVRENSGVKAYLKSIFVTIREDELDLKYRDIPEVTFEGQPIAAIEYDDPNIIDGEIVSEGPRAIE